MQTKLAPGFSNTPEGKEADAILRKCVHCGFCNATCPTYQLLGDELDGPRGRIYLIKHLLEGGEANPAITRHLDRCLTCRACESTCPSGVEYGKLLEIGRTELNRQSKRPASQKITRSLIATVVSNAKMFGWLLKIGNLFRWILPAGLKSKLPRKTIQKDAILDWPVSTNRRKMVALKGCVQASLTPQTNAATAIVLDRLGITLVEAPEAGCCGAVALHTVSEQHGRDRAKRLIDVWWPLIEQGIEGFVMTASGCGVTVKEYPHLFRKNATYYRKAKDIADITMDLSEVIDKNISNDYPVNHSQQKVAFHSPCTLQHGQKLNGMVEGILTRVGYELCEIKDSHLCCGSAGTYSLLQPKISEQLRGNKIRSLYQDNPDIVCTANVGCQVHLNSDHTKPRIKHWIELLL